MKLKGNESILVLRCGHERSKSLEIVSSLASALPKWSGRDRASPLFEVEASHWTADFGFGAGKAYLIFLGPVNPALADDCLPALKSKFDRAWLTLGLFNLAVYTRSTDTQDRVLKWAIRKGLRWEMWRLKGPSIESVRSSPRSRNRPQSLLDSLSEFQLKSPLPELRDSIEEYCALFAAAGCRSCEVGESLNRELEQANAIIIKAVIDHSGRVGSGHDLPAIALLVDANAALSRFTSQMFSGISPIFETECHFWTHSLLGTGVANLALVKIRRFITRTLGEARIPEQIDALRTINDSSIMSEVLQDGPIWNAPWLHKLPDAACGPVLSPDLEPLCPLVTYLSGRDGFHTTQVSLSAPLNILTSCSSSRWSLLTVTHEMSHRIIDEVLSFILPDPSNDLEMSRAVALLNETCKPSNLLECLQLKLLDVMAKLNAATPLIAPEEKVTPSFIMGLIGTRREEIEEVMVHVFDFIYFYGAEPNVYVPAIWRSWDAIPSLHRRLSAYVLRTLCAVYARYWSSSTPAQDAVAAVVAGMEIVAKNDKENAYIQDALEYLNKEKESLLKQMRRRRTLIGLVVTFLQSPLILQSVRGQSDKPEKNPDLIFDGSPVENPLRFVEAHTSSTHSSPLKSFVLLTRLAFDTTDPEPLRLEGVHR